MVFASADEDSVLEALMEADVDVTDLEYDEGKITLFVPDTEHHKAKLALQSALGEVTFEVDEIQFVPKGECPIAGEDVALMEKFVAMLDDLDDVQNIYHDAQF
jgi:transcriptional/translational regulatory protein YebC/TACO1